MMDRQRLEELRDLLRSVRLDWSATNVIRIPSMPKVNRMPFVGSGPVGDLDAPNIEFWLHEGTFTRDYDRPDVKPERFSARLIVAEGHIIEAHGIPNGTLHALIGVRFGEGGISRART